MQSLAILFLASLVSAQVAPYGQCGGSSYTGTTTCETGWVCQYQNEWYSQCVAGESDQNNMRVPCVDSFGIYSNRHYHNYHFINDKHHYEGLDNFHQDYKFDINHLNYCAILHWISQCKWTGIHYRWGNQLLRWNKLLLDRFPH